MVGVGVHKVVGLDRWVRVVGQIKGSRGRCCLYVLHLKCVCRQISTQVHLVIYDR